VCRRHSSFLVPVSIGDEISIAREKLISALKARSSLSIYSIVGENNGALRGSQAQGDQTEKRLSRMENYDIHIEQDADNYMVHGAPTLRDHGQEVFGGASTYVVRRITFQIAQVTPSK
jgi:hypothetical protein